MRFLIALVWLVAATATLVVVFVPVVVVHAAFFTGYFVWHHVDTHITAIYDRAEAKAKLKV